MYQHFGNYGHTHAHTRTVKFHSIGISRSDCIEQFPLTANHRFALHNLLHHSILVRQMVCCYATSMLLCVMLYGLAMLYVCTVLYIHTVLYACPVRSEPGLMLLCNIHAAVQHATPPPGRSDARAVTVTVTP